MTRNKSNFMSVNSPYGDDRNTLKEFLGQNKNSHKQFNENDFTDESNTSRPSFTEIFKNNSDVNQGDMIIPAAVGVGAARHAHNMNTNDFMAAMMNPNFHQSDRGDNNTILEQTDEQMNQSSAIDIN